MKRNFAFVLLVLMLWYLSSCNQKSNVSMNMDNLYAWCIVPFDSLHRTPEQRIDMLKRLGFRKYAYDWRTEYLEEMTSEFRLARENGIEIIAVWMWIDPRQDSVGALSADNRRTLENISQTGLKTTLWVSFHPDYFKNMTDEEALRAGTKMIAYLAEETKRIGCRLALYNHGDWFGNPANQIRIIRALPQFDIGIIYNFHHAHDQIDDLDKNIEMMLPYLWAVSLNGMKKEGPMILPIGKGDYEKEMIGKIIKSGYKGLYGVLGHVESQDVEKVLQRNLEGLNYLGFYEGGNSNEE